MCRLSMVRYIRVLCLSLLALVLSGGAIPLARAHPVHHAAAACAESGTYMIGRQALPVTPQAGGSGTSSSAIVYPYPGFGFEELVGSLVLTSSSSCGGSTAGSFNVRLLPIRYPRPLPEGALPKQPTAVAEPIISGTTVLTATGTFVQDVAHADDPLYVLVSAKVTFGRIVPTCLPPCVLSKGGKQLPCLMPSGCYGVMHVVVTRVSSFTNVTGYLVFSPKMPTTLGFSVLPPPDLTSAGAGLPLTSQPLTFWGVRPAR